MKPRSFEYLRPADVQSALAFLAEHREDARVLAGGQSLVPLLNFRMSQFKYLIDINRIAELSYIERSGDTLRIGATTRYRMVENSELVARAAPLLSQATKWVAHLPVRTRGTIGGSLAHADPAAEYPAVLLALNAFVVVQSSSAKRVVPMDEFILGTFATALDADELLTEIVVPVARANEGFGFAEFSRRPGDLAMAGAAVRLEFDAGRIRSARVVIFGVEGGAQRVAALEDALADEPRDAGVVERILRDPLEVPAHEDIHASSELRSHIVREMIRRAILNALEVRP